MTTTEERTKEVADYQKMMANKRLNFIKDLCAQLNQAAGKELYVVSENHRYSGPWPCVTSPFDTFYTRTNERDQETISVEFHLHTPDKAYFSVADSDFAGSAFNFAQGQTSRTRRFPVKNGKVNAKAIVEQLNAWDTAIVRAKARDAEDSERREADRQQRENERAKQVAEATALRQRLEQEARASLEAKGFKVTRVSTHTNEATYINVFVRIPSRETARYHGDYDVEIYVNEEGASFRTPIECTLPELGDKLASVAKHF